MHPPRRPLSRRSAFTLIETIATIVVLAAMGVSASFMLCNAVDSLAEASVASQLQAELSIAMERIDRELRNITLDAAAAGAAPDLSSVTSTSITWNSDCSLSLSGDQLLLAIDGAPSGVLLDDVSALSVQAYDQSGAALGFPLSGSACDPIRRLQVQITMQRSGVVQTLRNKVFLRCMMENAG